MSKCEISIEVEGGGRCRGGETVRGVVRVRAREALRCRAVTLEHRWQTHGRGTTDKATLSTHTLREGALPGGEELELPFALEVPPLPITYHGHYINIDHYLTARVDVPLGLDAKLEQELLVDPGERPDGGHDDKLRAKAGARQSMRAEWIIAVGAVLTLIGVFLWRHDDVGAAMSLFMLGLGVIVVGTGIRQLVARRALGRVTVDAPSWRVYPGAQMPISVRMRPRTPLKVRSIKATLTGREECRAGSGTQETTYTHTHHTNAVVISEPRSAGANEDVTITGEIPIPAGAVCSFSAWKNEISWTLQVEVDIEGWLAWSQERAVVVRPWIIDALPDRAGASSNVAEPSSKSEASEALAGDQLASATRMLAEGASGRERENLIAAIMDHAVQVAVEVTSVEATTGPNIEKAYAGGRTVIGRLGDEANVAIRFPREQGASISMVSPGALLEIRGKVVAWNDARARPEIEATGARVGRQQRSEDLADAPA